MIRSFASLIHKLATIIFSDYTLEKDPSYKKLTEALTAAGKNDWGRAGAFLSQVGEALRAKENGYKEKIPSLSGLYETFAKAVDLCKEKNPAAIKVLTEITTLLKKTEEEVNKVMYPARYRP